MKQKIGKVVNKYSKIIDILKRNNFVVKSGKDELKTIVINFLTSLQGWAPVFKIRAIRKV